MPDEFVWEIMVADLGDVRFVGHAPSGYPTEMWLNGEIVEHDMGGSFAWSIDPEGVPIPTPLHQMNETVRSYHDHQSMLCGFIEEQIDMWSKFRDDLKLSEASRIRFAVYAQYGKVAYSVEGCDTES